MILTPYAAIYGGYTLWRYVLISLDKPDTPINVVKVIKYWPHTHVVYLDAKRLLGYINPHIFRHVYCLHCHEFIDVNLS